MQIHRKFIPEYIDAMENIFQSLRVSSRKPRLRSIFVALLHRLPSICELCGAWPSQRICLQCWLQHAPTQHRCDNCAIATPNGVSRCGLCITHPPAFDACFAVVDYRPPWVSILHQFKFGDDPAWSRHLVNAMQATSGVKDAVLMATWVIPVPLADIRLSERGYNQSLLLAKNLSPEKTISMALHKLASAAPQRGLSRAARLNNLQGAFAVDPIWAQRIHGQRCVLVDDVMTTGATLHAASLALKAAGAAHVSTIVFARTPND
jgi:ComF family protein